MEKVFLSVLNMSLTASFVIAAISLARLPLKKAPKSISYALWAVAGFRLVFPFTLESVFSLLPFNSAPIPQDIAVQAVPRIDSGIAVIDNAVSAALPAAAPYASINPLQILLFIGSYIWIFGIVVMLIYSLVSIILLKRRLRGAALIGGNLYEADNLKTPFVIGLWGPKIYIPAGLSDEERRYIILHEQTHIRRHDHIVKMVAYFVLCLHWFNPLAWAAFVLMGADMEMSCDERVMKELGVDIKNAYSLSLVRVAAGRKILNGSPLAFGEGGMKERIKNVLNFKKPSRVIIIAAVALVAVLSVGFAVSRASAIELPDADSVLSVSMNQYNDYEPIGEVVITDKDEISQLLNALSGATKTWRQSVNDYPIDDNYLIVRLHLENEMRTLCLYTDGSDYIEEPYVGIYRSSKNASESLHKFYTNTLSPRAVVDIVTIVIWKDDNGQAQYSLFDGEVTPAPSELVSGRAFSDIDGLNGALKKYPQDTISMVYVEHTMDFTKDEMTIITDMITIPSGNYSKPTGLYEFHITTLDEARTIVDEYYPDASEIRSLGEETISYTNPPAPVGVYTFAVDVNGETATCTVSKERGIFFTYSDDTWWAFTGLKEWSGETRLMTLADVRAIAEKIGPDLTLEDLRDFIGTDIGFGRYIYVYEVDGGEYQLIVNVGGYEDTNAIIDFGRVIDGKLDENAIDIRYYDVDKFIADGTKELVRELPSDLIYLPDFKPENGAGVYNGEVDGNVYGDIFNSAILKQYGGYENGFLVYAPTIHGVYEESGKLKAFVTVFYEHYSLEGKILESVGGGVIPGAITFTIVTQSDGWVMEEYTEIGGSIGYRDGAYFADSIRKLSVLPVSGKEIRGLSQKILDDYSDNTTRRELLTESLKEHLLLYGQTDVYLQEPDGRLVKLT